MGNSLLEITVFGRRAGVSAAAYASQVDLGTISLGHLNAWLKERADAGLEGGVPSPILLPDYTRHGREPLASPVV